jgi:hypothetical protein
MTTNIVLGDVDGADVARQPAGEDGRRELGLAGRAARALGASDTYVWTSFAGGAAGGLRSTAPLLGAIGERERRWGSS